MASHHTYRTERSIHQRQTLNTRRIIPNQDASNFDQLQYKWRLRLKPQHNYPRNTPSRFNVSHEKDPMEYRAKHPTKVHDKFPVLLKHVL